MAVFKVFTCWHYFFKVTKSMREHDSKSDKKSVQKLRDTYCLAFITRGKTEKYLVNYSAKSSKRVCLKKECDLSR